MLKSGTVLGKSGALEKQTRGLQSGTVLGLASEEIRREQEIKAEKTRAYAEKVKNIQVPSKNPAQSAEEYAKKATAGDGYESLSLDELKLKTEKAKKDYENGFKGENIIQTGLNLLGGYNAYKNEYEKLREAYNNRLKAFNEYNRNIAIQKGEKTYDEKEYDIKSKGALGKTVDVLEHIDNTVSAGGNMFRQGANATMNATLGNLAKAFGFKDNIFQQGYDYATYANDKANEKMELSAKQLGDKNNVSGTLGANIVNMALDMAPIYLLGGTLGGASTLEAVAKANLGLGAKSASLLTATQRGITELAKNPMFFTSFAGEVGNDYYEAMANGATESQAMLAALTASTVNAALEVGGVQELPSKLLENKSLGKKTLDWVLSSLSEGKEEVLQDFISQLSAKAIYDKDKEVFSLSDQGAIINPERMAKEFGLGAAAGGLMGGGMLTFNSIVNSKTKAEYKQIGATARKLGDVDGLINYAQRSIDNDIRTLAYNTDSESISDLELGQLYAYACRDIDGTINSPKELNIAIDNFNEIASSTDSKLINGIASSRIIERMTSAGIDSESAKYMAESANSQLQNGAESDIISSRGESYVRTDEFRRLQAESKGMSDEDIQLYHSGKREVDEELRKNISGILRSQIDAARNGVRNDYGILNLSAKGNQFNLYQNVDGELFHDVFEIARSYLRNGELVDLHGVNTTDEGIGYNDCFNYLSEDGLSGFSITPDGDLISVFNASGKPGFLNAIAPQVKEKVKTLDCYNSSNQPLMGIYSKVFGFKTASVMDYNMEYDHDNIAENHGNPQVAFMVNTDDEVETKHFTKEQYDEAKEYRDGFVKSEFGTKSVFTEYSAKKYKADPIESYMFKEHGREKLSDDQLQIVMVARKLGHSVVYEDTAKTRGFKSDGYIENDGTIHIDYDNIKPVQFVFKHELTHYAEGSELYKNFVETVKASKTYSKWISQKVGGNDSAAVKSAKYRQSVIDGYAASGIELTPMQAESELIADFVGDTLFTEDGTGLEGIMSDMNAKQRKSFVQYIRDFFAYIKDKLSRNKTATRDILKLEKMFNETLSVVEQKNTADEGGVKYSFAGERAVTADKSLLETAKQRIENGEDSETVRRETGWFKGYDGKWRFEINDKMSELVENPKLETHGNDEDGLYQTARLADVLKHDDLFKAYPELKDYKVIIQETNTGVEGSFFPKRKEIVLSRNLFERITKEYYDYLNGGRKAEIAKIEQTPEYKEYSKFYDNPELANIDPEEWLKLEKEARDKFFSSELGKRYYQLNWGKVDIRKYEPGWSKGAKAVLFHEIQHAIQNIEGFASGSNITNWQSKINSAESEYRRAEKEYEKRYDGLVDVLARYGFSDEKFENIDLTTESGVKEAKKYLEEVGAPNGALELADALIEYANDRNNSFGKYLKLKNRSASDLYESTAGEIESRDVEKRLNYSAEQRKNTLPDIDRTDVVFADGSTGISLSKDISEYPYNMQTVIKEYMSSVDESIEHFIKTFNSNNRFARHKISNVTENQATDIKRLLGIDVNGFTNDINTNAIRHIEKRHGKNGIADSSMSNISDIARIGYVLKNYDDVEIAKNGLDEVNSAEFRNSKNEPAPMLIFSKKINGTYYVAQAIPDSEYKKLWIVSAYISEKEAGTQALNTKNKSQVGMSLASSASDITVPQKAQSVNTSISENAENSTEKFSIPFNQAELLDKYDRGEISREEYLNQSNENWKEAVNNYGTIETGENPVNDIPVPKSVDGKQKTQRFSRTVIESGKLTNRMVEDMGADILLGKFAYTPVSDESAQAAADKAVKGGFAESSWQEAVNASKLITKDKIAIGEKLLMQAIANKDTKRVLELSAELSDVLTRNGQNIQAASMFKKMTGAGKLLTVQQYINTLNKDLEAKYGENAPTVKINELIAQQIAESKPGEDIYSIYEDALQDVAAQVPATFLDKWNAWRYMAMLVNPTTHLRNIAGNGLFIPSVRMKDFISASLETAFIKDKDKRTKSIVIKKEYKEFAKKDLTSADVKNALKSGGKFNIETKISEKQRIFKNNVLEFIRVGNGNLLESEDLIFKNIHYKHALAGFLQARGADLNNIDDNLLWEARAYAVQEAMKATFNDANSISTALSAAANKNKTLNIATNGILPFKKTPINVVRRGVEYSPIGLLKTVVKGSYDLKQGKITASEYIDGLGAGISGSVVFALGALLSSLGWVTGGFGDDDEDKFKQLNGEQEYALQLFGKSYTIDWAAPACIPFFIGVETVNALREDNDNFKLSDITDAMWNSLEPVINLSMLSGVQSMIESVKYAAEDKSVISLAGNIAKSYFSQGLPTVLGKTARTLDSKRRSNYIDKNSQLSEFSQSAINTAKSKIPGLEATRPEYINAWGQAESNGNIAERIFGNFVSPGYYSDIEYSEMSKELLRLSKEVKSEDVNVLPKTAQKSFEVNGKTKYLTAEEYTKYAKAKGRYSYDYVSEFVNSSEYKKLTDEERAKVISNLYKYANAKAKTEVSDYDITKSFKTVSQWDKRGKSPVIYYIGRVLAEK